MKERPILFNGPMVRAIIEGRKTQTRRVVDLKNGMIDFVGSGMSRDPDDAESDWNNPECWGYEDKYGYWATLRPKPKCSGDYQIPCPLGAPGDRLWVREAWSTPIDTAPDTVLYRADYPKCVPYGYENIPPADEIKWKPSIHMPRWASRITLEIKRVWVERVQEISEADAIAEGAEPNWSGPLDGWEPELHGYYSQCPCGQPSCECTNGHATAKEWFQELWDSINAKTYPWASNPWVWCIEFERVEVMP